MGITAGRKETKHRNSGVVTTENALYMVTEYYMIPQFILSQVKSTPNGEAFVIKRSEMMAKLNIARYMTL